MVLGYRIELVRFNAYTRSSDVDLGLINGDGDGTSGSKLKGISNQVDHCNIQNFLFGLYNLVMSDVHLEFDILVFDQVAVVFVGFWDHRQPQTLNIDFSIKI